MLGLGVFRVCASKPSGGSPGSFFCLTPMPPSFVNIVLCVGDVLCVVDADCARLVIQALGDDLEGVTSIPCPPVSPMSWWLICTRLVSGTPILMQSTSPPIRRLTSQIQTCIIQLLVVGACFLCFSRNYIFLRLFGVPKVERINMLLYSPYPNALVAMESISICATAYSGLRTACKSLQALCALEWISFLPLSTSVYWPSPN